MDSPGGAEGSSGGDLWSKVLTASARRSVSTAAIPTARGDEWSSVLSQFTCRAEQPLTTAPHHSHPNRLAKHSAAGDVFELGTN